MVMLAARRDVIRRMWLLASFAIAVAVYADEVVQAHAKTVSQTLDDVGDSPFGLGPGVDRPGGAVAAWMRSYGPGDDVIFVSIRHPGRSFGAPSRLPGGGARPNGFTLAVGALGDAAIVWHPAGPDPVLENPKSVLLVNRRTPGKDFGPRQR